MRRFSKRTFSPEQLVEIGSLTPELLDVARTTLRGRGNILVSGGTGSGKTTLLNALIELLPADERIVSIEDTLELRIDHANAVRFEARELGSGSVTIRDLVKHSLRHRPDHIVVGEVRGAEAADLLQALNTGHGGSAHHRSREQRHVRALQARELRDAGRGSPLGGCLPERCRRDHDGPPHDASGGPEARRGGPRPSGAGRPEDNAWLTEPVAQRPRASLGLAP